MANTDPLRPAVRKSVANQIAGFPVPRPPAPAGTRGAKAATLRLGDPYALCVIGPRQVASPPAEVADLLAPSGSWIHTVLNGNAESHCAISRVAGFKEDHEVLSVVMGPLGDKINETARWLNEHDTDDAAVVRVLYFPAHYIYAFGILRDHDASAVLISQPEGRSAIKPFQEYSLKDFLEKLTAG